MPELSPPCALQADRVFTDDGDGFDFRFVQRQELALVFEQDNSFLGNLAGDRLMRGGVKGAGLPVGIKNVRRKHDPQIAPDFFIQTRHRQRAIFQGVEIRLRKIKLS
jgi:hypothetical protein